MITWEMWRIQFHRKKIIDDSVQRHQEGLPGAPRPFFVHERHRSERASKIW